ncbi:glycosyltransferase family 4 protein [Paenibacillus sp. TH7-28]
MDREKTAVITTGSFVMPSGRSSSLERVIENVVPLAAEHVKIRIFGLADGHLPSQGWIGNVPVYRLPGGRLYLESILRHLRKWRPGTVDVHNRPLLAFQLKSRLPLARVLLTLHSAAFISPSCHPKARMQPMLESVDGIIVGSEYLKEELLSRFPGLFTPIWVNPPGVTLEDFVPRWTPHGEVLRTARLAEYGWENRKVALFVGRLLPAKGVHHLLAAFPAVLRQVPEAMLLIVGDTCHGANRETDYVSRLKAMAEPFKERVVFLPFTPYSKVADWYNTADCLVVPSCEEEAFGLVNVEAMASAVPIVAARAGSIPEIVADGYSGFLVPAEGIVNALADRVIRLLQDEALCKSMGQAGQELARSRFRWQHTAERWVDTICSSRVIPANAPQWKQQP